MVNAGIYKFNEKIFDAIKKIKESKRNELELTDEINLLAKKTNVFWVEVKQDFFDLGSVEDLKKAEQQIRI